MTDSLKLGSPEKFNYLNKSGAYTADGIDDKSWFSHTKVQYSPRECTEVSRKRWT